MRHEYRLGRHSIVHVGPRQVAVVSRETRGWAILSRKDYAKLASFFAKGAVQQDRSPTNGNFAALERLYDLGLMTRDGAFSDSASLKTPAYPESLLLKMTGRCNFGCTYCYDFSETRSKQVLDRSQATEAIDTIVKATGKLTVTFHGGEPLLRFNDIKAIVRHCEVLRKQGAALRYALQTNGSLLTEEVVNFLDEHAFSVGISLDGLWPETDAMRVSPDSSQPAPSAVFKELLRRYGDFLRRRCGVLAVLYRTSLRRLPEFALWLQDQGIRGLSTTVLDPSGRGRDLRHEEISPEDLVGLYKTWLDLISRGRIASIGLTNLLAYMDNLCSFDPPSFCQKGPCGAAGDFLVLDADGAYRACDCVIHDYFVIGDRNVRVEEVLRSATRKHLLERYSWIQSHSECADCAWIRLCGGTCAAKALGYSEDIHAIYLPECAINKFLYPALLQTYARDPESRLFRYHRKHSRLSRRPESAAGA